ncbi:MAG: hypothetical protein H6807_08610 [Planctomycetes bacterium]|nr:hypothetical protein [Planctomycetota bacterium]
MKYLAIGCLAAFFGLMFGRLDTATTASAGTATVSRATLSGGVSLSTLPLGNAFSVEFDVTSFPNLPFPYGTFPPFLSGKNLVYTVPTGQALVLTNVEYYFDAGDANLGLFVIGVDGVSVYRRGETNGGTVAHAVMSPIVVRENQEVRLMGRYTTYQATFLLQGYLIAMSDL